MSFEVEPHHWFGKKKQADNMTQESQRMSQRQNRKTMKSGTSNTNNRKMVYEYASKKEYSPQFIRKVRRGVVTGMVALMILTGFRQVTRVLVNLLSPSVSTEYTKSKNGDPIVAINATDEWKVSVDYIREIAGPVLDAELSYEDGEFIMWQISNIYEAQYGNPCYFLSSLTVADRDNSQYIVGGGDGGGLVVTITDTYEVAFVSTYTFGG